MKNSNLFTILGPNQQNLSDCSRASVVYSEASTQKEARADLTWKALPPLTCGWTKNLSFMSMGLINQQWEWDEHLIKTEHTSLEDFLFNYKWKPGRMTQASCNIQLNGIVLLITYRYLNDVMFNKETDYKIKP